MRPGASFEGRTRQITRAWREMSANRGHQNALLAGLFGASGDAIVSIDADLQDDVTAIEVMVDAYLAGKDVVTACARAAGPTRGFKRGTAELYYKILASLGVKIVYNHADFRLLSRRALEALKQYSEVNMFIRGIVPLIGYPSETVYYERSARFAGESKYPLQEDAGARGGRHHIVHRLSAAFDRRVGHAVSMLSVGDGRLRVVDQAFLGRAVPGWASSVIPIYFLGGIQLLSIGVLGEYVAKLYFEAKRRPRYFVEEQL